MNLVIRQSQLTSLVKSHYVGQAAALYPSLEARFPERCKDLGKQGVIDLVQRNLAYAYARGLDESRYGSMIADLVMRWGDITAGEAPWAAEVLNETAVPADLRVYEIEQRSETRAISKELQRLLAVSADGE